MTRAVTTVYLVRHGETDWNAADRCQGSADVPMNAAGRAQIAQVAEDLRGVTFTAVYCSTLARASETARLILDDAKIAIVEDRRLCELNYGTLQGLTRAEWPAAIRSAWNEDPWSVTFPEGESLASVRERVSAALADLLDANAGGVVLVCGHGLANRVMLTSSLGLAGAEFWSIAQPNGGVLRIEYHDHAATALSLIGEVS